MIIQRTDIADLYVVEFERHSDDRGFFARVFDRQTFSKHGLVVEYPQHGVAKNIRRGTLRGMHYQTAPFCEVKVVRCERGRVFDVVLDVRRTSPSFGCWRAFELSEDVPRQLYVGAGLAHGYVTLTDDAELHYLLSASYSPAHAVGVNWRDAGAAIDWPLGDVVINDRDASLPPLSAAPDPFSPSVP